MAKAKIPGIKALSEGTQEFYDVLNQKSDFAVILIAAGFLDAALVGLLSARLCDEQIAEKLLEAPSAALGGFAARVDMAYAIGLIRPEIREDLLKVARIRNKCAHSHLRLNFEEDSIRDIVSTLSYLKKLDSNSPPHILSNDGSARSRFVLTVVLISQRLLVDALGTQRIAACHSG